MPNIRQQAAHAGQEIQHWFNSRLRECFRCFECGRAVSPWDTHCAACGQAHPARIARSAGVWFAVAAAILALGSWALMRQLA